MNTALVRYMFLVQAALLVVSQLIFMIGILSYPDHVGRSVANGLAAIGYALLGGGYWMLVRSIPGGMIRDLRPAFLLFGLGDIFATVTSLIFLNFDIHLGYPAYSITADILSVAAIIVLSAAWFCWVAAGRRAPATDVIPAPLTSE